MSYRSASYLFIIACVIFIAIFAITFPEPQPLNELPDANLGVNTSTSEQPPEPNPSESVPASTNDKRLSKTNQNSKTNAKARNTPPAIREPGQIYRDGRIYRPAQFEPINWIALGAAIVAAIGATVSATCDVLQFRRNKRQKP